MMNRYDAREPSNPLAIRRDSTGLIPRAWTCVAAALVGIVFAALVSAAALGPPAGSVAPPIKLPDLNGKEVELTALSPRSQVIVFGDLSHEGVRSTMSDVVATAADPRHAGDPIVTVLVISHNETPDKLKAEIAAGGFPSLILYDQDRSAFGAYRILVMPTVVVVDPHGKVVSSMSGPVQQFKEKLSAALLLCAGRLSDEQFQHVISPETPTATAPAEVRADRLIHLGNELVRHGLFETAETRFKEAIDIAPGNVQAKLGLAGVMLRTGRIDEAEAVYQVVATADKGSVDAAIGLATVQTLRGGENLDKADLAASELVAKYPSNPKARFLMGLIYERKGNCTAAVAEFKRAAELLIGN